MKIKFDFFCKKTSTANLPKSCWPIFNMCFYINKGWANILDSAVSKFQLFMVTKWYPSLILRGDITQLYKNTFNNFFNIDCPLKNYLLSSVLHKSVLAGISQQIVNINWSSGSKGFCCLQDAESKLFVSHKL
jgi:hypothetical protein